jgi:hypothetical protein
MRALRTRKPIHVAILRLAASSLLLACILLFPVAAKAQEATSAGNSFSSSGTLPDAPQPGGAVGQNNQSQAAAPDPPGKPVTQQPPSDKAPEQTKRILGIVPNFRSVSADVKLPPQSVKDKFMAATDDSFDYSSIFLPAVIAGYSMAEDSYPEFHQGAAGYARYFWHAAVDQTSENYMVEFIVPSITREDTRYYTLGHGGFLKRTGYALSRAVITRNDAGQETFNFSEVVGAGASSGLSSLYYPSRERSLANTGQEWGLDVGIDAASFVVREFWPDVNRRLFHRADVIQGDER